MERKKLSGKKFPQGEEPVGPRPPFVSTPELNRAVCPKKPRGENKPGVFVGNPPKINVDPSKKIFPGPFFSQPRVQNRSFCSPRPKWFCPPKPKKGPKIERGPLGFLPQFPLFVKWGCLIPCLVLNLGFEKWGPRFLFFLKVSFNS